MSEDTVRPRVGRRVAVILAVALVGAFIVPIGFIAAFGPSMMAMAVPKFSNTTEKVDRAALMRPYAIATDPTIDPMRAGEAFHSLGNRTGYKLPAGLRPMAHGPFDLPAADTLLFRGAGPRAWSGPSPLHLIELARKGFSRPEMDYLAAVAGSPVWTEYAIVARATRMDKAGAMYVIPFDPASSPFTLPITRFAATKEIAYAGVARAAWHLANGRPKDADTALREIVSNGLRLIDDGNTLIDELIGAVIVGIGRSALEQLYDVTGNPESARMRAAAAQFDTARARTPQAVALDLATLPAAIADSSRSRGLRQELTVLSSLASCASVRTLLLGPPASLTSALGTARRQLVRTDAEGALFDLNTHALDHASRSVMSGDGTGVLPRAFVWVSRVPATLLRNPRIADCTALVASEMAGN